MDTEKPVLGAAMVAVLTAVIMRLTPRTFDRKRFAVPVSLSVGWALAFADAMATTPGVSLQIMLYQSLLKGLGLMLGAGGAYAALKNYMPNGAENDT